MANLQQFREKVTIYRKRQVTSAGTPHTQQELAMAIGLSADELGHRLRGTGRSRFTRENVLAIVRTLAEWETLTWDEAIELLVCMDYPLDQPDWKTELQRVLLPSQSDRRSSVISAGTLQEKPSAPVRRRLFQARDLPRDYVPRPTAFDAIKRLLLTHEDNQATAITTALRGAGGFGKTTLALALCHDPDIQAAFPDGILWVELGEHPPRPLDVLNGVLHSLDASLSGALTLEEARENFRTALQWRVCLLVIDDVWQAEALTPLLEGGPQCVRLVTTRNDHVLPEKAAQIFVDAMEPAEAIAVLCHNLPAEIQQASYQPQLQALVTRLGCWPLLLTLARGMLDTWLGNGKTAVQALSVVEQAYQKHGVVAFHLASASERQRTAEACLDVSLRHLKEFTPRHYHAIVRYQELAVFPEDTDIPLSTLQIYWQGTGGLDDWETEDLCSRLHGLSLLLTCDLGQGTIRVHDVLRSYLIQRAGKQVPTLHQRLLQAYQQHYHLKRWAALPESETYLWHYLVAHLHQADHLESLQTTLTDLLYLTHKAQYLGVLALEADLVVASTSSRSVGVGNAFSRLASLHRTIMRISDLLQQVSTEAEIGGLLLSYLPEEEGLATLQFALERELPRPFFTAWHPLPRVSSALLRTLTGHTSSVSACRFSPNGKWIVSASFDGKLKVWEAATGKEYLTLLGHTSIVSGCAFSPDGKWIVSASHDGTLKLWETATGKEHLTLTGHTGPVFACAFSPDGRFIVSASDDHTLKVWEAATGGEVRTLTGHTGSIHACGFSPDGRWIVSASYDQTLKVWDVVTGTEQLTLRGHTRLVSDCGFSPDGRWIVSASWDNTLKLWEAATGAEVRTLSSHKNWVTACEFSPDGRWIVSAAVDGTLKLWEVATGKEHPILLGHTEWVTACAFSPDGKWIVSDSTSNTLKLWEVVTGGEYFTRRGHTNSVSDCAFSPDGKWIVSGSQDHTLKVWEAATGKEHLTLTSHTASVSACAFSPDGKWIVSASSDEMLKVWEATTGKEHFNLSYHSEAVSGCAFSPDGKWIVSASFDGKLKLWEAATGKEHLTLTGHTGSIHACGFSPDGRWIVSASYDQTLRVWEAATGKEHLTLAGHIDQVNDCAFSPDSKWIVSASEDRTLKLWDSTTGAVRLTLSGHTSRVHDCAFSPDGKWIVSASYDQTLKVWDVQRGQCVLTYPVGGALYGCAFHPDGEHLVACGDSGMYFLRLMQ